MSSEVGILYILSLHIFAINTDHKQIKEIKKKDAYRKYYVKDR